MAARTVCCFIAAALVHCAYAPSHTIDIPSAGNKGWQTEVDHQEKEEPKVRPSKKQKQKCKTFHSCIVTARAMHSMCSYLLRQIYMSSEPFNLPLYLGVMHSCSSEQVQLDKRNPHVR